LGDFLAAPTHYGYPNALVELSALQFLAAVSDSNDSNARRNRIGKGLIFCMFISMRNFVFLFIWGGALCCA
jgi:hypothetical protein